MSQRGIPTVIGCICNISALFVRGPLLAGAGRFPLVAPHVAEEPQLVAVKFWLGVGWVLLKIPSMHPGTHLPGQSLSALLVGVGPSPSHGPPGERY